MASKVLDYVPQYDAVTCQSAAIARVIGSTNVRKIRNDLLSLGSPGDPTVMGAYLRDRVTEYKYNGNASLNDAIAAIKAGYQLITHGYFTESGHVIGLSGWDAEEEVFNAEDPWFEFHFAEWSYEPWEISGDDQSYSARGIWAACVVGQGPGDAADFYGEGDRLGPKEYAERGLWLHMVKN
jgi:hypothetical protein